jgi:predicted lipoprotein with Yx(FWY)xxD motif
MEHLMPVRVPAARPLAVLVVTLLLAACAEEPTATSTSPEETPAATPSAEATETEAATAEPTESPAEGEGSVLVADSDLGSILTDADGMTIYFFANDTEGVSNCEGDCLANWPPVEAEDDPVAGEGVTAELGTIERSDGTRQLTVNGFPAYYFAGDSAAGDTNGQGVGEVWFVFGADGEPIEG